MAAMACLMAVFFLLVLGRAYDLMILQGEKYARLANSQTEVSVEIPARRGEIFDRNGAPLAVSVEKSSIYLMPGDIRIMYGPRPPSREDLREQVAGQLALALGMPVDQVRKRIHAQSSFQWLARKVDDETARKVRDLQLAGVGFVKESERQYPNGSLAIHALGMMGLDKGIEGVEEHFNDVLNGRKLNVTRVRDARGLNLFADERELVGSRGADLWLTIDRTIQLIVEQEIRAAHEKSHALRTAAVVQDPATGDILAIASWPAYEPENFQTASVLERYPFAFNGAYEPGSTMKVFTLAAALDHRVLQPDERLDCENGRWTVGGKVIKDDHRLGLSSIEQILAQSSNICSAKIGLRLGGETLRQYFLRFGFGARTGVDHPADSKGLLQPAEQWGQVVTANVSFGQGISVTPLQLTSGVSAIANGGVQRRPRLVRGMREPGDSSIREFPLEEGREIVSASAASIMKRLMHAVTGPQGTGKSANVEGFKSAGKTGTAQKAEKGEYPDHLRIASYAGFIPLEKPRITILVIVDEPKGDRYGSQVAAPVFSRIAARSLKYLGVTPVSASGVAAVLPPVNDPAREEQRPAAPGSGKVPELRGLSMIEAMNQARDAGLRVAPAGSGIAEQQDPPAGNPLPANREVRVFFTSGVHAREEP
ncbi:MAG: Stage V sporulation protein D [Myxococcota bacterium]|nr:Stage V sporulation protein D [Myxococcota bacterium]